MRTIKEFKLSQKYSQVDGCYVQRSYIEVSQKVGLLNIKTKIYQTIKGLIIIFIKF